MFVIVDEENHEVEVPGYINRFGDRDTAVDVMVLALGDPFNYSVVEWLYVEPGISKHAKRNHHAQTINSRPQLSPNW